MLSSTRRGTRRELWLLACGMALAAAPAPAQERWQDITPDNPYGPPRPQQVQPIPSDNGADLRRNLTTVGTNPENVSALVESGRAALRMGDAQAALTFFSRADEVAPRDARVKAGMGSAMVQLGQPRPALTLFAEATGLGAPEIEIASDRGLAHDLNGDPRAAQRDYALVLRRRDDAETRRRLALSLAISGQREPALRLIEPQIRQGDRAAWRTQAFVLALTGDATGAARIAGSAMPGAGTELAPFLGRLPALSPAQRAMAVHLGVFPSDGRAQAAAGIDTSPDPGALALAGGPAPAAGPRTRVASADPRPGGRRRTGSASPVERGAVGAPNTGTRRQAESVRPSPLRPYQVPGPNGELRTQVRVSRAEPPPAATQPESAPVPAAPEIPVQRFAPPPAEPSETVEEQQESSTASVEETVAQIGSPAIDPAILAGARAGDTIAGPGFSLTPQASPAAPPPLLSERRNSALGDIAMVVNALPQDQGATRAAPPPARRPAPSPPAAPARHWVQIAGGIDRASMSGELRRLRGRAPALLDGMQGWTSRAGGTSRLLVGPFGSPRDAQSFVNQLRPRGIEALAWSSESGQAVERLAAAAGPARAGRAAPDQRAGGSGTRGHGETRRAAGPSRPATDRRPEMRAAAGSPRAARGRAEATRSGGASRGGRAAAETRSNRNASTVQRRANGNDTRTSRGRSAPEQRPSSRGRRSD